VILLLVMLGWALVSGMVYGARSRRSAFDEAATSMSWVVRPGNGSLIVNGRNYPLPAMAGGSFGGSGSISVSSGQFTFYRNGAPVTAPSGRDWSQVRWQTWTGLGSWSLAALAAAALLLLVVRHRHRIGREGPSRGLLTAAAIIVALCAAGQVYTVVKDLV
jgi:hypothetical protein